MLSSSHILPIRVKGRREGACVGWSDILSIWIDKSASTSVFSKRLHHMCRCLGHLGMWVERRLWEIVVCVRACVCVINPQYNTHTHTHTHTHTYTHTPVWSRQDWHCLKYRKADDNKDQALKRREKEKNKSICANEVCVCVCVYAYICVCVWERVHTHIGHTPKHLPLFHCLNFFSPCEEATGSDADCYKLHTHMSDYIHMRTHKRTHTHTHMSDYIHTNALTHTHTRANIYTCVQTHTHTHTLSHTHRSIVRSAIERPCGVCEAFAIHPPLCQI